MSRELPVVFSCAGCRLVGILHPGRPDAMVGVVIVIGGPQYRVGSHRQFVLMARELASRGIPVFRFDYRGMGDSEGKPISFENVSDDISAAITCLQSNLAAVEQVVLLGLCDAASASLMYAPCDRRVRGLILVNPWVRTPESEAASYVRHYYLQRLMQKSFWRKVLAGRYNPLISLRDFAKALALTASKRRTPRSPVYSRSESFVSRMRFGLQEFCGPILLLLSERDLVAREFMDLCDSDPAWRQAVSGAEITRRILPDADHTMSAAADLAEADKTIVHWIREALSV